MESLLFYCFVEMLAHQLTSTISCWRLLFGKTRRGKRILRALHQLKTLLSLKGFQDDVKLNEALQELGTTRVSSLWRKDSLF